MSKQENSLNRRVKIKKNNINETSRTGADTQNTSKSQRILKIKFNESSALSRETDSININDAETELSERARKQPMKCFVFKWIVDWISGPSGKRRDVNRNIITGPAV